MHIASKVKSIYDDVMLFVDIIRYWRAGKISVSIASIAIIVAALIYVINPLDLIPDFIPFVGFTDDATTLAAAMSTLSSVVADYKRKKAS